MIEDKETREILLRYLKSISDIREKCEKATNTGNGSYYTLNLGTSKHDYNGFLYKLEKEINQILEDGILSNPTFDLIKKDFCNRHTEQQIITSVENAIYDFIDDVQKSSSKEQIYNHFIGFKNEINAIYDNYL